MSRYVTNVLLFVIASSLLITLLIPYQSINQFATGVLIGGIIMLAIGSVLELIVVLISTKTSSLVDTPAQSEPRVFESIDDDDGWTDALVEGTAADIIDWEG